MPSNFVHVAYRNRIIQIYDFAVFARFLDALVLRSSNAVDKNVIKISKLDFKAIHYFRITEKRDSVKLNRIKITVTILKKALKIIIFFWKLIVLLKFSAKSQYIAGFE